MQTPDEVAAMLRLKALGWGVRRIAGELGCSHMTVRRYLSEGGWVAYRGRGRPRTLTGLEEWVAERFRRHAGNADVVRQELEREKGIRLTLRTVEREVRHLRRELEAEARATIRFETPPGKQLQIDFGERRAMIGDENVKVYLFVATLGYSRRLYVRPFRNERQESWFAGVEGAFRHFGGITEEVLLDNDRGLVARHDRVNSGSRVQCPASRVRQALGFSAARLCTLPGAHQGEGRAWRRLCQEERHCWTAVRELVGIGSPSRGMDARRRRSAGARHDRRGAD